MSRKVPDNKVGELDPKQILVLENLLTGASATAAAKAAGVNRRTIWHWIRADVEFQAALNGGRRELRESSQARLESLAEPAVKAVEKALTDGDVRTALSVLRGLGLLGREPASIGSDDPAVIARGRKLQEAEQRRSEIMEDLLYS
jgi:hypothetical protein